MSCSKQHYASAKQKPTSTSQMYQKDQQRKEQEEQQKFSSTSSNNREHQDGQNSLKNGGGGTPTDEEWEEDFEDFKEEINLMELSDEETVDEADLTIEKTALKRLAIIDTLNLIHECAKFSPFVKLSKSFRPNLKCDALAILLLCRQLLLETFDLKLFIPDSYLNPNGGSNREKVTNIEILEELQKLGYLTTIRDHSHDDLLLLEYAKCTGGFIISNDKFRDHEQTFSLVSKDDQALRVIRERVVRFRIRLEDVDRLKDKRRSGKQLMGLAKGKHSDFLGIDIVLEPPSFKAMYAHPLKIDGVEDPTYGVVLNQRVQRSQRDAEKALERLTVLSHYYRLEVCSFHSVHAEPLPWFDPAKRNLPRFYTFWRDYSRWQDDMAEQKQQDQQQQGPQLESQKRGPYYR